jgi:hypothetical protein
MSTENNNSMDAGSDGVQIDQQIKIDNNNVDTILNYNDSPHKGININDVAPDDKQKQIDNQVLFGKYKSIEDAQKGYQSAEAKIREQGTELNKVKEQLSQYQPMDDYSTEAWVKKIGSWKEEKSLPEEITYDPSIPEINMLLKGFEKAGVSEKQAKEILAGAVEQQITLINEKKESIVQELGNEGMKKVEALNQFGAKLSKDDMAIFGSLFAFPYVESEQVDLMYRLLCGGGEKSIPTGVKPADAVKSSVDIYKDIMAFQHENKMTLPMDTKQQQRLSQMWIEYENSKTKGY